ncbi:MAG: hypothetical protein KAI66_08300 [Lentisphaeria bacterium]|nr:hypothetical protein [Lentisphaeria bacterium]
MKRNTFSKTLPVFVVAMALTAGLVCAGQSLSVLDVTGARGGEVQLSIVVDNQTGEAIEDLNVALLSPEGLFTEVVAVELAGIGGTHFDAVALEDVRFEDAGPSRGQALLHIPFGDLSGSKPDIGVDVAGFIAKVTMRVADDAPMNDNDIAWHIGTNTDDVTTINDEPVAAGAGVAGIVKVLPWFLYDDFAATKINTGRWSRVRSGSGVTVSVDEGEALMETGPVGSGKSALKVRYASRYYGIRADASARWVDQRADSDFSYDLAVAFAKQGRTKIYGLIRIDSDGVTCSVATYQRIDGVYTYQTIDDAGGNPVEVETEFAPGDDRGYDAGGIGFLLDGQDKAQFYVDDTLVLEYDAQEADSAFAFATAEFAAISTDQALEALLDNVEVLYVDKTPYLSYIKLDGDNRTGQYKNDLTFKSTGHPHEYRLGDFSTARDGGEWLPLPTPNAKGTYTIHEVDIRNFMDPDGGDTSGYLYLNVRNLTREKTSRALVRTQKPSGSYYGMYNEGGSKNKLSTFAGVMLRTRQKGNSTTIRFTDDKDDLLNARAIREYDLDVFEPDPRYDFVILDPLENFWSNASRKYYMQLENELGLRSSIYTITARTVRPVISYAILLNDGGKSNRLTDLADGRVLLRLKASRKPVKYQLADTKDFSDESQEHFFEDETEEETEGVTRTYQYYRMALPSAVAEYAEGVLWKYFYLRVAYLGDDPTRHADNYIWSGIRRIKVYIKKPTVTYKVLYNDPDGKNNKLTAYDNVRLRLKGTYNPVEYMLSDDASFPGSRSQTFGGDLGDPDENGYFDVPIDELDNFQGLYSKSFYVKVRNPVGFWSRSYRFTVYAVRPSVLSAALVDDMRRSNILSTYNAQIRFKPRGNPDAYRLSDSDNFDGAITRQLIEDNVDASEGGTDMEGIWLYKDLPQPLAEYDLDQEEFSRYYYLQVRTEDNVWSKTYRLNVKIDQPYTTAAYLRNAGGTNNKITTLVDVTLEVKSAELPTDFWLAETSDFAEARDYPIGPESLTLVGTNLYRATVELVDFEGATSKKYYLKVRNDAGRESTVRTITVTAVRPNVTSVSPGKGQFVGGKIVVKGTGFGTAPRKLDRWIRIGGVQVDSDDILSWTDTLVEFVVPEMDDRADGALLEVKTENNDLPYQRAYKAFESPVGTWAIKVIGRGGSLVSWENEAVIFRHSDRYFLVNEEAVGELIATPDSGKLSGKVYYYNADTAQDDEAIPDRTVIYGVEFLETVIESDGIDTVTLYFAELQNDARAEGEVSGTWKVDGVTTDVDGVRNDEVEKVVDDALLVYNGILGAGNRWSSNYMFDETEHVAWGHLTLLVLAEKGADEVLLYTPPGEWQEDPRREEGVPEDGYYARHGEGTWMEKNTSLSEKYPFDVWLGALSSTISTNTDDVRLKIGDDDPMTLLVPADPDQVPEDYESITCNHTNGGVLDLSDRADVTFEYTFPDGMDPREYFLLLEVTYEWKTSEKTIIETADYAYDAGANTATFTIDSSKFTAGRAYSVEMGVAAPGLDGGAGAPEAVRDLEHVHLNGGKSYSHELSLIASADGEVDDSYSIYYTKDNRFPDRSVTWIRIANAVNGVQTVAVPGGAVGLRILTHGRTEIARVSYPEGDRGDLVWNWDTNWDHFRSAIVVTGSLQPESSLDSGVLLLQNDTSIELNLRDEGAGEFSDLGGDITITPVVEVR